MAGKKFAYQCCCKDLSQDDVPQLNDMINSSAAVSYRTMLRNCEGLIDWAVKLCYDRTVRQGLTLKTDRCVRYYRSHWKGRRCYYLVHSWVEYIWVEV